MARAGIQGGRGAKGRGGPPQQQQRGGTPGGGGGQPNMQQLMALQQQLVEAQERIAAAEVEGDAGNGLVTAVVTGSGELLRLTVKPEVVDPEDVDTLVDLVVYAVQDAQKKASELQSQAMGPLSGGIPGLPF